MFAAVLLAQLLDATPAAPTASAPEAVAPVAPEAVAPPAPSAAAPAREAPIEAVLRREPAPAPARRFPFEVTAQITVGGGGHFGGAPLVAPAFALGVRLDFLLLRRTHRSLGIGPFAAVRSDNFADLAPAAGLSLLLPVTEALPLVLSVGGVGRWSAAGFDVGLTQRAFWGIRSLNLHQAYALAIGVFLESRQFFARDGGLSGADVVAGIDIDFQSVVVPWMALYSWLFRTDPVR